MLTDTTVNSVPRFENAWMQRSKFPYTARSSAKIIRHAVSIDERRAKFRSDLISETKMSNKREHHHHHHRGRHAEKATTNGHGPNSDGQGKVQNRTPDRFRRPSKFHSPILSIIVGVDLYLDALKKYPSASALPKLENNNSRFGFLVSYHKWVGVSTCKKPRQVIRCFKAKLTKTNSYRSSSSGNR